MRTLLFAGLLLCAAPALADKGWRAIEDVDLSIVAGNALDFSSLVAPGPAGKYGRVIANADGQLAFAERPAKRQRFLCASQPWGVEEGFPDHETADRYARQLRMHGYNLARFHFVDKVLMSGRSKDFDFDPEQLDRFHYFMAALKREGIYWILDALTSWNGAYGDVGPDRWADKRNVKLGVYLNPEDQAHWKKLVDKLLAEKNPYTGVTPLEDPALVAVITVNEGGLNSLLNHKPSAELDRRFNAWLEKRYGNVEKAAKSWGVSLRAGTPMALPHREWHASPRMADAQRFYHELQLSTLNWMAEHLRRRGYRGFISGYDNWFTLQDIATRASLDFVATHAYHDEPSAWVSSGSTIQQSSAVREGLSYVRDLAAGRHWGKPYAVTEYDQPFWNRYRYESGLAVGAYGAFQDWDLICRHASGPIQLAYGARPSSRHQYLFPYAIGLDPVARAAETLAALLFLREDVKPSAHRVTVRLSPQFAFDKQGGIGFLPDDTHRLGLLTGVGVAWDAAKPARGGRLVLNPDEESNTRVDRVIRKVNNLLGKEAGGRWPARIAELRESKILTAANGTDAARGMLESDTGQIRLDTRAGNLRVVTPRTEAWAFDGVPVNDGGHLQVRAASDPTLVAASSLDGKDLPSSGRILLIFASDARNTGMEFADAQEKVLRKLGGAPVRIKAAQVHLHLRHKTAAKMKLYALKLNGERGAELPVKIGGNGIEIRLDIGDLPDGPTTYFELVRQTG